MGVVGSKSPLISLLPQSIQPILVIVLSLELVFLEILPYVPPEVDFAQEGLGLWEDSLDLETYQGPHSP